MLSQQVKPNRWSCLPVAFANSLNVNFSSFIAIIGHDGSEIIRGEEYPEDDPRSRRGFHPGEIVDACLTLDVHPILIHDPPMGAHRGDTNMVRLGLQRMLAHLFTPGRCGVIEFKTPAGGGHAVSFETHLDEVEFVDPQNGARSKYKKEQLTGENLLAVWLLER